MITKKQKRHSFEWYKKHFIQLAKSYFTGNIKPLFSSFSDIAIKMLIFYFMTAHTGKMFEMVSIGTSCLDNPFCKARQCKKGCVCAECYARKQLLSTRNVNQRIKLHFATLFFTTYDLQKKQAPMINRLMVRFESFGDIINELQVKNYFTICRKNPSTNFTLWSKNLAIVDRAITKYGKPENLTCVQSSEIINLRAKKRYAWIDKVFTVYTEDYAIEHNITINCGVNECNECRLCYMNNSVEHINELLKQKRGVNNVKKDNMPTWK